MIETLCNVCGFKMRIRGKGKKKFRRLCMSCEKNPPKKKTNSNIVERNFYLSQEWRGVRFDALMKHGRRCAACGRTPPEVKLHVDHIKPRSTNPELELSLANLQVLCEDCNIGKSNRYTDNLNIS